MRWVVNEELILKILYTNHQAGCIKTCGWLSEAGENSREGIVAASVLPSLTSLQ